MSLDNGTMVPMRMAFIYVLRDPCTTAIRYVGKTVNPRHRLQMHEAACGYPTRAQKWIKELKAQGFKPDMDVIDSAPESDIYALENWYIEKYRNEGCDLLNAIRHIPIRGCGWTHTEATKKKIGDAHRGKDISTEIRERIAATLRGRKMPEEQRQRMLGRKLSPESIAKRSATMKANTAARKAAQIPKPKIVGTPEWCERISRSVRKYMQEHSDHASRTIARFTTPEARENYYKALPHRHNDMSEATRRKRAESLKRYLANLTPEQKEQRMAAARAAQQRKASA